MSNKLFTGVLPVEPDDSKERKEFKNRYNNLCFLLYDLIKFNYFSEFKKEDFFREIVISDDRAEDYNKNKKCLLTISLTNN